MSDQRDGGWDSPVVGGADETGMGFESVVLETSLEE